MFRLSGYFSAVMMLRFIHFLLFSVSLFLFAAAAEKPPREANIAYFIQVSESTITLLPRLLKVLWHEKNLYVLHFDKKIPKWQRDYSTRSLLKSAKGKKNIVIMPSEVITYRGISMVINSMNAMQTAKDASTSWDFFINLSGSDYPLISPANQRVLLGEQDFISRRRSFFSISNREWWAKSKKFRFSRLFTDTSLSMNGTQSELLDPFQKQPLFNRIGFEWVAAESWMILHRSFVNYLLTSGPSRRYFAAFSYVAEPEEHYFATVAYNTPQFNDTLIRAAFRHVVWVHNGKHSGQHPYHVDDVDSKGRWKFKDVVENSRCFFTRKIQKQNSQFWTGSTRISAVSVSPRRKILWKRI